MKFALIITGQLRTTELTKYFHKKTFIDNPECDIFLSIDSNNETQLLYKNETVDDDSTYINTIIDFYKPKGYYVGNADDTNVIYNDYKDLCNCSLNFYDVDDVSDEKQQKINNYLIGQSDRFMRNELTINNVSYNDGTNKKGCLTERSIKGLFRQFYFVKKGYNLLLEYKNKNNITYDLVIRMRFDHIIMNENFCKTEMHEFETNGNTILFNENNMNKSQCLKTYDIQKYDDAKQNTIKTMGAGVYKKYVYVNDFFWTHGDDLIDKMRKFYDELHDIIKFTATNFFPMHGAGIEHYFAIFLYNNDININLTDMNKCNIIRKYN